MLVITVCRQVVTNKLFNKYIFPYFVLKDRLRLVLQLEKTAQDCSEPVYVGFAQSFLVHQLIGTGLGLGLSKFGQKTRPDRTFNH